MHCKSLWIKASAKCINVNVKCTALSAGVVKTMSVSDMIVVHVMLEYTSRHFVFKIFVLISSSC